jgi:hypothetical protein
MSPGGEPGWQCGVYQRYEYAAEKRRALDAWANRLKAIVHGSQQPSVAELRAGHDPAQDNTKERAPSGLLATQTGSIRGLGNS